MIWAYLNSSKSIHSKHTAKDFYIVVRIKERTPESIIFNGPNEMLIAGLSVGYEGDFGDTYNIMPAEFCEIYQSFCEVDWGTATKYQTKVNRMIEILLSMIFFWSTKKSIQKVGSDWVFRILLNE